MISITLMNLAKILHGKAFNQDVMLDSVVTDTRKISKGCLFVAIKGKYFDAHDFSDQAKKSGAGALLVNRKIDIDLPQIVVKDTRISFGLLAAWVRQQVSTRVVALTGSSGKTSVKEMTASILNRCGKTLYTEGNLNNDIGVATTLLRLNKSYKNAVIELGTNSHGEISRTVNLTCPEAVLVNNFSESHLRGFGSIKGVAKEKGEIFTGLPVNGIAIINNDSNDWTNWKSKIGLRKVWSYSLNNTDSDFTATNVCSRSLSTEFTLQTPIGNIDIRLPLPGRHNISNAIAASALSMSIGASLIEIKLGLINIKSIPGRLFPILLKKNKIILDDSYNANVDSMIVAAQVLSKMPGYRVMVAGDMADLGDRSESCHIKVGKAISELGIDHVLSIGKFSKKIARLSGVGEHFSKKSELLESIKILIKKHKIITILIKGSRRAAMEEIVHELQENKIC